MPSCLFVWLGECERCCRHRRCCRCCCCLLDVVMPVHVVGREDDAAAAADLTCAYGLQHAYNMNTLSWSEVSATVHGAGGVGDYGRRGRGCGKLQELKLIQGACSTCSRGEWYSEGQIGDAERCKS